MFYVIIIDVLPWIMRTTAIYEVSYRAPFFTVKHIDIVRMIKGELPCGYICGDKLFVEKQCLECAHCHSGLPFLQYLQHTCRPKGSVAIFAVSHQTVSVI